MSSLDTTRDAGRPSDLPIGVFDSGVGGLTVLAALRRKLPAEHYLYLGDTARLPYGSKSPQTVLRYVLKASDFLLARGVKAIVVACNTASAVALEPLAGHCGVPVIGVIEAGAAGAVAVTRGGPVGVIGTESTIASGAYVAAIRRQAPDLRVVTRACPLFVPLAEEGWEDHEVTRLTAEHYLAPLREAGIDTLVLGCTHYPLLAATIARVAGPGVMLVDSATAVAGAVAIELAARGLARQSAGGQSAAAGPAPVGSIGLFVTDAPERFERLAARILGSSHALELVDVL